MQSLKLPVQSLNTTASVHTTIMIESDRLGHRACWQVPGPLGSYWRLAGAPGNMVVVAALECARRGRGTFKLAARPVRHQLAAGITGIIRVMLRGRLRLPVGSKNAKWPHSAAGHVLRGQPRPWGLLPGRNRRP